MNRPAPSSPFLSRALGPRFPADRNVVAVTPRHLAGGGDPRWVTGHLMAHGWRDQSVPGYPHVLLSSPDQRFHLTLELPHPDSDETAWRFLPAEGIRHWQMAFGAWTPVEIIAGAADALTRPDGPHLSVEDVWEQARANGWTEVADDRIAGLLAPPEFDGTPPTAFVLKDRIVATGPPAWAWRVHASAPRPDGSEHQSVWSASIDDSAPPGVVAGFLSALTDPAPLYRTGDQTPYVYGKFSTHTATSRTLDDLRAALGRRLAPAGRPQPPAPAYPPPGHGPTPQRR
ncbi:DUF317 domain-containing protein [Streptomyces sp. NPDC056401]|uniref:DUF317 domain-containing protein n=1 Tax=Streptomyces sp. NPDC056401 TaxID=3345809 RepID=UPI0035DA45B6